MVNKTEILKELYRNGEATIELTKDGISEIYLKRSFVSSLINRILKE